MSDEVLDRIKRDNEPFVYKGDEAAQRTAQWLYERVGHCTASRFGDVMATRKDKKEAAPRRNYRVQLAVERLLNEPQGGYVSPAMEHGTQYEPEGRMAYEAHTGEIVEEGGFVHHPALQWCGGSPDGLVGKDGLIEIKCPFEPAVHVETVMNRTCEDHMSQLQGLLWITGRKWCDFVSYDPRMPQGIELYVQRIPRNEDYIAALAKAVEEFLNDVERQHAAFMEMVELSRKAA